MLTKIRPSVLREVVKERLSRLDETVELRDKDGISKFVSAAIDALEASVEALTPWSSPCPRSIPGFDQECKDICTKV